MRTLLKISRTIDNLTDWIGRSVQWLVLAAIIIGACNAVVRYILHISSNAWLEMQWYLGSAVFLLCGAYALRHNQHVRVDVISSRFGPRTRAWIEIFGTLFLLFPMVGIVLWYSWPVFVDAYQSGEISTNANGLILWPARLLVPVGFFFLVIQGVSEVIKRVGFLADLAPDAGEKSQEKTAEEQLAEDIKQQIGASK
ncbi:MAG: TRAP transporter small permease subunit [Pseudomonadota bacterium]